MVCYSALVLLIFVTAYSHNLLVYFFTLMNDIFLGITRVLVHSLVPIYIHTVHRVINNYNIVRT